MLDCWEFKKCGRDKTGDCPAYQSRSGKICWVVAGTICDGVAQGTFAEKIADCAKCDFYRYVNEILQAQRTERIVLPPDLAKPSPPREGAPGPGRTGKLPSQSPAP